MTIKDTFLTDGSDWHESGFGWENIPPNEFDYVCKTFADVQSKELDYLKNDDIEYKLNILAKGGKDWIIEPLKNQQPESYAVLQKHASQYYVGFKWWSRFGLPEKDALSTSSYLEVCGRLIRVESNAPTYEEGGPWNWLPSFNALPETLSKSWLWRTGGWGIKSSIPGSPLINRQLIGGSGSLWSNIENILNSYKRNSYKKSLPIIQEQIPDAVMTHYNPHDGSPSKWQAFRCFLDTRPEGLNGPYGDQFFVVDEHTDQTVYHIHDGDIKNIRVLHNPGEAIDAYCAHTLLRTPGRFDFMPWSEPLK